MAGVCSERYSEGGVDYDPRGDVSGRCLERIKIEYF